MIAEITLDGIQYRIQKMPAMKQFHILRRLALVFKNVSEFKGEESKLINVLMDGIGSLPDEDANYILQGLLSHVSRRQSGGTGWATVMSGASIMFDDLPLKSLMQLAFESLRGNFKDFLAEIPSGGTEVTPVNQ